MNPAALIFGTALLVMCGGAFVSYLQARHWNGVKAPLTGPTVSVDALSKQLAPTECYFPIYLDTENGLVQAMEVYTVLFDGRRVLVVTGTST